MIPTIEECRIIVKTNAISVATNNPGPVLSVCAMNEHGLVFGIGHEIIWHRQFTYNNDNIIYPHFIYCIFMRIITLPGDFQVEIPVEYSRGGARREGLPQVKVHLTFDEPILEKPVVCSIKPRYSDLSNFKVHAYAKKEIVVEKLRSLLQQQKKWPRPRDLYDLWYILCRSGEKYIWDELFPMFKEKCQVRNINPDIEGLTSRKLKDVNAADLVRVAPDTYNYRVKLP